MIQHVWLIPAIMALAALVNGLGVRRLGKAAGFIATGAMAACFLISVAVFMETRTLLHEAEAKAAQAAPAAKAAAEAAGREFLPLTHEFEVVNNHFREKATVHLWDWFTIPGGTFANSRDLNVGFSFYVDTLTAIFLLFVSLIGTFVFLYATGYMKEKHHAHGHDDHGHGDHGHAHHHATPDADGYVLDPGYARFFCYVALFAAMMFTLVLGDNLLVMFIGWEGVGLCSYLLIGYFFDRPFSDTLSCADAGRKAFVMNRIGDFGLIVGMALLFWGLGTINIQEMVAVFMSGKVPAGFEYNGAIITAACLLLFLGATGKSAQIPLFTWLPDAMAGPTPVSALIHAATMVTAGVYMVARLNVLFMHAPSAMAVVAIVGALTAFVAAFAGLTQRGIKKALAYSTVSQLGFMFLAMGVGAFSAGIFHVFTHAFFKGCLFLAAGSVIHALHHEEDMYKMGGLRKHMPITALTYLAATLCIAGFPLTSGFFSKDEILYMAYNSAGHEPPLLWYIGVATAFMTALYMGRTYFLTFAGPSRLSPEAEAHVHESPRSMTTALLVLAGLGVIVGFLNVPKALFSLGEMTAWFHHWLAPVTDRGSTYFAETLLKYRGEDIPYGAWVVAGDLPKEKHEGLAWQLAAVSIVAGIGGLALSWLLYGKGIEKEKAIARGALRPFYAVSENRWWWDDAYNALFKDGSWITALAVWKFDMHIIDGIINGVGNSLRGFGRELRRLQNGQVQIYGLVMIIGLVAFMLYFALGLDTFMKAGGVEPARKDPITSSISSAPATLFAAER